MSAHAEAAGHGHEHHHGPPIANKSSKVDATVLGMFLFIGSEAMLFGSFFAAYFFVRVVNPDAPDVWPPPPFEFPKFVAGINTAILVTSSFTMHWALQSIKRNNRRGLQAGLVLTILMGTAFLLTQFIEYAHVGFNTSDGAFASVFFGLTGLHGAHVFVGLTLLDDRRRAGVPRPLLAGAPSRRRAARDLLALRRRDVDRRLRDRLPDLAPSRARPPGWWSARWPGSQGSRCRTRSRTRRQRSDSCSVRSSTSRRSCVAAWVATWLGVIVFVVMSVLAFVVLRRGTASEPPVVSTERAAVEDTRRILVVADDVARAARPATRRSCAWRTAVTEDVLLICAGASLRPASLVSDEDGGPDGAASEELEAALHELRAAGINARGDLGVGDPLQALEDALRGFAADEIVISTPPPRARAHLARAQASSRPRARRFDVPVTHVIGDDDPR